MQRTTKHTFRNLNQLVFSLLFYGFLCRFRFLLFSLWFTFLNTQHELSHYYKWKKKKKKKYMILGKKKPTKVMCRLIEMFYRYVNINFRCFITCLFWYKINCSGYRTYLLYKDSWLIKVYGRDWMMRLLNLIVAA